MPTKCPICHSDKCIKYGVVRKGIPRFKCKLCNGQFTLTEDRKKFIDKKFMALHLYLNGLSVRKIARELRVSDTAVHKWMKKYKTDIPSFKHRLENQEDFFIWSRNESLREFAEYLIRQSENRHYTGGIFIQCSEKFFKNRILIMELVPKNQELIL